MAHAKQIRILSVEDHPVFRHGLATIIETEPDMVLVAQAANGVEAIAEFRRHRPDITLEKKGGKSNVKQLRGSRSNVDR